MSTKPKTFEAIEHTADVGLRIYGRDLTELFTNAALGLLSLITTTTGIQAASEIAVALQEDNREELLVAWLNEVLFYVSERNFNPKEITIDAISERMVEARLKGQKRTSALLTEIKAATYHELEIKNTPEGLEARVIFDT